MATISLDIDGTFTEDPVLWEGFIIMAANRGHKVIAVTFRFPQEADKYTRRLEENNIQIVYTGRTQKRDFCLAQGIEIDIWIDDMPWII